MSYDLLVFDPAVSTPGLRLWLLEIGAEFPPMNGPYAMEDFPDDEATLTDYSVGREAIYAFFAVEDRTGP